MRRALVAAALLASSCFRPPRVVAPIAAPSLLARGTIALDSAPKEEPRLVPPEAYVKTYLQLFGGLAPLEVQRRARSSDGNQLFDTWADYLAALGFPDYRLDLPRAQESNALMVATWERLGDALCDRAVEHDLKGITPPPAPGPPPSLSAQSMDAMAAERPLFGPPPPPKPGAPKPPPPQRPIAPPVAQRVIFAFEVPATPIDAAGFAPRFDVLHRTFLGYPAALAATDRTAAFFQLYTDTLGRHMAMGAPKSRFSPTEEAWATVCYGLVRHPEFLFY